LNAERLHAIAIALRDDLAQTDAVSLLGQLAESLERQVQNPADASAQQQVSSIRQQLDEALSRAPSNDFSAAWQQALEELGVADLFGERLRETLKNIFERNEITPATAAEEARELSTRLTELSATLNNLVSALDALSIGAEELSYGEFEVGVLIPRAAVSNELKPLANELRELDRILLPFLELTTGERPDYEVRSLSSSAFQVFLESPGATAAGIALAIERLVALYKQLLDIRLARKNLEEAGVPEERLDGVTQHADEHMSSGILQLVDELLERFGERIDEGRRHELRMELTLSLTGMANRIDRGYHVEVRAGLPPPADDEEPDEGEDGEPKSETRQHFDAVSASQEGLKFMKLSGPSILSLPDSEEPPEEGEDSEEQGR
jgi:hypothetical protein